MLIKIRTALARNGILHPHVLKNSSETNALVIINALIITSALVSEEFFNTWGWRIPFLASAVLILISMYIQLNLEDTKAFKALAKNSNDKSNEQVQRSPVLEAIRRYPKRIMLAAGAFLSPIHI